MKKNKKVKSKIFHYNFLKKNHKGFFLASETLKIIIALICISFLIYFLSSLYFSKINNEKQKQASFTLEEISKIIENVNETGENINAINPIGWYLFSFVEDKKPNFCHGENCLCICDKVWEYGGVFGERQIKECDKNGACLVVLNLESFEKIEITKLKEGSTNLNIKKLNNKIKILKLK